mgnify:CR=1 FL=1
MPNVCLLDLQRAKSTGTYDSIIQKVTKNIKRSNFAARQLSEDPLRMLKSFKSILKVIDEEENDGAPTVKGRNNLLTKVNSSVLKLNRPSSLFGKPESDG